MNHGRRAAVFDAAVIFIPGFARIVTNAGAATDRAVLGSLHDEAGLKVGGHEERGWPVLRPGGNSRAAPGLAFQVDRDRAVLRVYAQVAAAAGDADWAVDGFDSGVAAEIMQADGAIGGVRGEFAVHGVQRKRAVGGLEVDRGGLGGADEQVNGPVLIVSAGAIGGNFAAGHHEVDLRQHDFGFAVFVRRGFARRDGIGVFVPAEDL